AVGCLYITSKIGAELTLLEQSHQAKQIAKGINGVAVAPVIDQKPVALPSQSTAMAKTDALDAAEAANAADDRGSIVPAAAVTAERELQNKVVNIDALRRA